MVGDKVYDLFFGYGHVKSFTGDDKAVVSFGARAFAYTSDGIGQHGRRSLYWHNPILTVPMKDDAKWEMQKSLDMAIARCLRPGS